MASKRDIALGLAAVGSLVAAAILSRRKPPPPPGYGDLWGYVKDAVTGDRIGGAKIYLDGVLEYTSNVDGSYVTSYVALGSHELKVQADDYTTLIQTIIIEKSTMLEILLESLPVAPTDWTEGITIRDVKVEPGQGYVGQAVDIKVYIDYPYPLPGLPVTIQGSVLVNEEKLTNQWTLDNYDTVFHFSYTPTQAGTYMVMVKDKSTTFNVAQDLPAHYYCPFGGVRIPIVTDVIVPDVEPFTCWTGTQWYVHPGGNLRLGNICGVIYCGNSLFIIDTGTTCVPASIVSKLPNSYPLEWDPPDSTIRTWAIHVRSEFDRHFVYIAPTSSVCQEYWNSKTELADVIHRLVEGGVGTGGWPGTSVTQGIKGLVYWPGIYTKGAQGYCDEYIVCPHCGVHIGLSHIHGNDATKLEVARIFLEHIEAVHPDHALTKPAWF